jgi:hypothetical protein
VAAQFPTSHDLVRNAIGSALEGVVRLANAQHGGIVPAAGVLFRRWL